MNDEMTIDKLVIEIDAEADSALKGLEAAANSLSNLKKATSSLSTQLNNTRKAIEKFSGMKVDVDMTGMNNLATALSNLQGLNLDGVTSQISGVSMMVRQLASDLNSINGNLKQFESSTQSAASGVQSYTNSMSAMEIANESCKSTLNTIVSLLQKGLVSAVKRAVKWLASLAKGFLLPAKNANKLNSSVFSLFGTIKKMTRSIASWSAATGVISALLSKTMEESASYTEVLNKLNVSLGESAQSAREYAEEVNKALGIDVKEFLDYEGTFGAMMRGFGASEKNIKLMSQNLTQLAYDYSSLYDTPVSEAFNKLNSAMSGQIKGLKEFGNNVAVARVQETALKYGITDQIHTLDSATQAYLRYITIMENAGNTGVFNDMARTINTVSNQVRVLGAQFTALKRAIGNVAVVFASKIVPVLNVVLGLLARIFNFIAGLFGFKVNTGLESVGSLNDGLEDVADSADEAGDSIGGAAEKAKELKKFLAGFDEINQIPAPDESSSSGSSAGAGAGAGGIDWDSELPAYDFLNGLESELDTKIDELQAKLARLFDPVISAWEDCKAMLMQSINSFTEGIKSLFSVIGNDLFTSWQMNGYDIFNNLFHIISNIADIAGTLAQRFSEAWEEAGVGTSIFDSLFSVVERVLDEVRLLTDKLKETAGQVDFTNLIESFDNLSSSLEYAVNRISDALGEDFREMVSNLLSFTIEDGLPGLINAVAGAVEGLSDAFVWLVDNKETILAIIAALGTLSIAKFLSDDPIGKLQDFAKELSEFKKYEDLGKGLDKGLGAFSDFISSAKLGTGAFAAAKLSPAEGLFGIDVGPLDTLTAKFEALTIAAPKFAGVLKGLGIAGLVVTIITALTNAYNKFDWFREKVGEAFTNVGKVLDAAYTGVIQPILSALGLFISEIWEGSIKPAWDAFSAVIAALVSVFLNLWNTVSPILTALFEWLGPILTEVLTTLAQLASGAINLVVGVLSEFATFIAEMIASDFWETLSGLVSTLFTLIASIVTNAWVVIEGVWNIVYPFFETIFTGIYNIGKMIFDGIVEILSRAWDSIKEVWDACAPVFEEIWNKIKETLGPVIESVMQFFSDAWAFISNVWSVVTDYFGDIWGNISETYSVVKEFFGELFSGAWDKITGVWDSVTDYFGGVWDNIKGVFSHVADWFHEKFSKAWEKVKEVFSAGGEIFDGIKEGILEGLKVVINALIDGINSVISIPFSGINWALTKIRDVSILGYEPFSWISTIDIPQIPKLAKGGVIDVNHMFIANEAGAEAVTQVGHKTMVSNNAQMMDMVEGALARGISNALQYIGTQKTSGGTFHLYVDLDGNVIAKKVFEVHNDKVIQTGESPLMF